MPNWCNNTLSIQPVDDQPESETQFETLVLTIKNLLAAKVEFMEAFYPPPADLENNNDWCDANWGTKWDIEPEIIEDDDHWFKIAFASAWSPPIKFFEWLAPQCNKLFFNLDYYEKGNAFIGEAAFEGDSFHDDCRNMTSDDLKEIYGDDYEEDEFEEDALEEAVKAAVKEAAEAYRQSKDDDLYNEFSFDEGEI